MKLELQRKRLNKAHKKVAQKLADPNYLSEWMCFPGNPWVGASFIDLRLDIDLHEIENITDEEIYELVYNKLVINLEVILDALKK